MLKLVYPNDFIADIYRTCSYEGLAAAIWAILLDSHRLINSRLSGLITSSVTKLTRTTNERD